MLHSLYKIAAIAVALASQVAAVGPTDSYTDADVSQSGYLPNHNMDPAVVDSSSFGQLWTVPFNVKEQVSNFNLLREAQEYASLTSERILSFTRNPLCTPRMLEAIRFCFWLLPKIGSVP